MDGVLRAVEVLDEGADAALIAHRLFDLFAAAQIAQRDLHPRVQERLLTQARKQRVVIKRQLVEDRPVRLEGDLGSRVVRRSDRVELLYRHAALKTNLVNGAVVMHAHRAPLGKGVDDRRAHAVQAAGDLVARAAELAARVQHRVDDLDGGLALRRVHPDGDAAPVVAHADHIAFKDLDFNMRAVARERLVDAVVDDLINEVMQPPRRRRADVHARALPDSFQPFEDLNLFGTVIGVHFVLQGIAHGKTSSYNHSD